MSRCTRKSLVVDEDPSIGAVIIRLMHKCDDTEVDYVEFGANTALRLADKISEAAVRMSATGRSL